jgi:hypothetical protein
MMHWCGLLLDLLPFKLVTPPFQLGVVESYPVQSV